ncbi:unnamed protein product [Prunus brigantina]
MKEVRAIPNLLMERTIGSCKLLSLPFTTHSLSEVCPNGDEHTGESRILEAMKRMQHEMDWKLEVRLTALERERGLDLAMTIDTLPFTRDILEFKLPKYFKQPRMQLYDGTIDSVDFLNDFGYWMNVKDAGDAKKCRAFPLLLEGSAKDWCLKLDSISSFNLLKQSFVNQFLFASKKWYPPNYLISIR